MCRGLLSIDIAGLYLLQQLEMAIASRGFQQIWIETKERVDRSRQTV